jgi:hypothetical protein
MSNETNSVDINKLTIGYIALIKYLCTSIPDTKKSTKEGNK